jgi:cytochrome c oxidase subunit 2
VTAPVPPSSACSNLATGLRKLAALGGITVLGGCVSRQSVLHPAGAEASEIATLFWIMAISGAFIWAAVMGAALYAVLGKRRPQSERFAQRFIFFGGIIFPTVTLAALLMIGLSLLPGWGSNPPPDLRIHVAAEQFWWRISYERADGSRVESANEVHMPVGQVTEFIITSPDVIHSFWIPALGGKIDAIPGRTTRLRLTPTETGTFRGVCAEFCGQSHALMAFVVAVHQADEFEEWLAAEAAPALMASGKEPLTAAGCLACHTVRGVSEIGRTGPDLTHFASRTTIAAGLRPNTAPELHEWLAHPERLKPDVRMPGYSMLSEAERDSLVNALRELR